MNFPDQRRGLASRLAGILLSRTVFVTAGAVVAVSAAASPAAPAGAAGCAEPTDGLSSSEVQDLTEPSGYADAYLGDDMTPVEGKASPGSEISGVKVSMTTSPDGCVSARAIVTSYHSLDDFQAGPSSAPQLSLGRPDALAGEGSESTVTPDQQMISVENGMARYDRAYVTPPMRVAEGESIVAKVDSMSYDDWGSGPMASANKRTVSVDGQGKLGLS